MNISRKVRYGMVGGGPGAFIGAVHRNAAALDGEIELVAGAFSSDPEKSGRQGADLRLDPQRVYDDFQTMARGEAELPEDERIDFVSIVTPNHLHYRIARTFIEAGFHVVCDKPMTTSVDDAETLRRLVSEHDCVFMVTHNYTGYPMVKEARHLVRTGRLGDVRKIVVEYPQGWLSTRLEATGMKQAAWRTDPQKAGVSSAVGDIGSHAENLAHYVTGLDMESLFADVTTFVSGRQLEDDASVLIRYQDGAKGILYASQVSVGEENNLRIRVYGTDAAIEWHQEEPNFLLLKHPDRPTEILTRGSDYLSDAAKHATRLPPGHPEAFIEAFANLYSNTARTIQSRLSKTDPDPLDTDYPTVTDGTRGVNFIHNVIKSGTSNKWVDASYEP